MIGNLRSSIFWFPCCASLSRLFLSLFPCGKLSIAGFRGKFQKYFRYRSGEKKEPRVSKIWKAGIALAPRPPLAKEEALYPQVLFFSSDHFGDVERVILHAAVGVEHIRVGQAEEGGTLFVLQVG